jgi:DNA-directed RNA polymerase subunit alpha
MLETSILATGTTQTGHENITPEIKITQADVSYARFAIEPLERGYGISVGNPMRRMLLSSIEGTAITWVKIDGILHEYSIIPHVKEETMEFLLNVRGIRIRSVTGRPGKMRLEITGEGRVCAGDIATSSDFEIVNPELHLLTMDSDDATLSIEFNVEHGRGYQPAPQGGDGVAGALTGALPVDAIFNPVRKVNYAIERTRVGHVTDYERLVLEVWTDGTITPVEALKESSQVLVTHFFLFKDLGLDAKAKTEGTTISVSPEVYQTPIEKLELSPRTLNCLKRAQITKVGQILKTSNEELLKIRNFGEKSLEELMAKLRAEDIIGEGERATNGTDASRADKSDVAVMDVESGDEKPAKATILDISPEDIRAALTSPASIESEGEKRPRFSARGADTEDEEFPEDEEDEDEDEDEDLDALDDEEE